MFRWCVSYELQAHIASGQGLDTHLQSPKSHVFKILIFLKMTSSCFDFLVKMDSQGSASRPGSDGPGSVVHRAILMGGWLGGHERLVLLLILLQAGRLLSDGGKGQLVMLHDVNLILILVFLHIEHFPEFLQLMELTEGFQDDQHGNESEEKVACKAENTAASQFDQVPQNQDCMTYSPPTPHTQSSPSCTVYSEACLKSRAHGGT